MAMDGVLGSTYTVQAGNSLWNIVKERYNLKEGKDNASIWEHIRKIQAANNALSEDKRDSHWKKINDPKLIGKYEVMYIYSGQVITFGDGDLSGKSTEVSSNETQSGGNENLKKPGDNSLVTPPDQSPKGSNKSDEPESGAPKTGQNSGNPVKPKNLDMNTQYGKDCDKFFNSGKYVKQKAFTDENGQKAIEYYTKENQDIKCVNTYNEKGNITGLSIIGKDGFSKNYVYDDAGNPIQIIKKGKDNRVISEYDTQTCEEKFYDENKNVIKLAKYDKKTKNILQEIKYNLEDNTRQVTKFDSRINGEPRISKIISYNKDKSYEIREFNIYTGLPAKDTLHRNDGTRMVTEFFSDIYQPLRITNYNKDKTYQEREYDRKTGKPIKDTWHTKDKIIVKKYDPTNVWKTETYYYDKKGKFLYKTGW